MQQAGREPPREAEQYLALHRLVAVPEDVGLDDVEAAVLGLLDEPRPHLGGGARAHGVTGQTNGARIRASR